MRDRLGRKTLQLHLFLTTAFRHGGRFPLPPFFAGERLSSAIPTGEGSLRLLGAINLLAVKYSTVFGVDMQSRKVSVFRSESLFGSSDPGPVDNMDYDDALDLIVTQYMHPEERRSVRDMLTREKVQERLNRAASFKVHCRILQDGVHYYYLLIARNGEDDHITSKRIYEKQLDSLISSLSHAAGYFHLDITGNRIRKVGGTSAFVDSLDRDCPIDTLMQNMSAYILSEQDRQDFLRTYNLESMKRDYEAGKVEIIRKSRCYYDDPIARWSRYTLRLLANPTNNHLEGVFFGMDVTRDREAYETQVSIVQTLSSNDLDVLLLNTREKTAALIEQMGGTLEVSSELGVGSTFVVTIPFALADEREIVPAEKAEAVSIHGMRILLAAQPRHR